MKENQIISLCFSDQFELVFYLVFLIICPNLQDINSVVVPPYLWPSQKEEMICKMHLFPLDRSQTEVGRSPYIHPLKFPVT
ncbi:hypothetical protein GDO86_016805 [Hymenochirus boettgeri]|uniref:Uncharacterized protein n=1 Tax=Hymenochirus boettgeri TaxID=247094 RepID=A0A8T2IMJ0_9PIPI|nr:hypothetical protein GDO86_016805 [Hymenochirus boettgeri]